MFKRYKKLLFMKTKTNTTEIKTSYSCAVPTLDWASHVWKGKIMNTKLNQHNTSPKWSHNQLIFPLTSMGFSLPCLRNAHAWHSAPRPIDTTDLPQLLNPKFRNHSTNFENPPIYPAKYSKVWREGGVSDTLFHLQRLRAAKALHSD